MALKAPTEPSGLSPGTLHETFRRQFEPGAGRRRRPLSQCAYRKGQRQTFRRSGNLRRDPGKCARRGCLCPAVDVIPGQRPSDGTADHDRCVHALLGAPHHRRDSLFRLCPAGSPRLGPHADLGKAGRQHDHPGRRRPRPDARSPCRTDPGLLRHSRPTICLPCRLWPAT